MNRIGLALALVLTASPAMAIMEEEPPPSCDTPPNHPLNGCDTRRNQCVPPFGPDIPALVRRATHVQQLQDVPENIRSNIRFATLHEVAPAEVQNLVVVFSGQNGISGEFGGGASNMTGQPGGWQWFCGGDDCGTSSFNGSSLAVRLMHSNVLGSTNTHTVVFPDHQYNWGYPLATNYAIEAGITNFVKSLIVPSLGKTIVLAGHSRGGCLAMSVAHRLQTDPAFRDVHLIVLPNDAVCDPNRWLDENYTSFSSVDNPLVADLGWYAWMSQYSTFSGLSESACVANIVGGALWAWPVSVHGLAIFPDAKPLNRFNNWWATFGHGVMGDQFGDDVTQQTIGSFYYFVKNNLAPPACTASSCPNGCCVHGVCVDGTATWGCGSGGAACNTCPSGQICSNQACVPPPCGPATCPNGCCTAAGVCVAGNVTTACGTGGALCAACSAPTNSLPTCSAGSCGFQCNAPYHTCNGVSCTKQLCN